MKSAAREALPSVAPAALALAVLVLSLDPAAVGAAPRNDYEYLSPVPGARMVSPLNNVVIRQGGLVEGSTLRGGAVAVTGERSGLHSGRLVVSDDGRTLVFNPDQPYAPGERVTVRMEGGLRTRDGREFPALSFSFTVSTLDPKRSNRIALEASREETPETAARPSAESAPSPRVSAMSPCDTLPDRYPSITLITSDNPAPGNVFIAPFPRPQKGCVMILDNQGAPIFYRDVPGGASDFTRQATGLLTYYSNNAYWGLDSSYARVDSFRMGNGYSTDQHDCRVLPNGHALLMAYDGQVVDMSQIVPGGNTHAAVVGLIIQEIDASKNVVFQWRSWDHYAITDMDTTCVGSLRSPTVDYAHGNSIEPDSDGNLIISSRNMNEITKIDRQTGAMIWRFGGLAKNNQFTIVGDPRGFSHQHDARRLPNGHLTLYDNGNCLNPQYSRGVEYQLDEVNKIATQVWEYRRPPDDMYAAFMGSVQRQPGGETMIGWGGTAPDPKLTEIHADGSIAYEIGFGNTGLWTYRSVRFPWQTNQFTTDLSTLDFGSVRIGSSASLPLTIENHGAVSRTLSCLLSSVSAVEILEGVPLTIPAGGVATVHARFAPTSETLLDGNNLYVRAVNDTELVARSIALTGKGVANLPAASPRVLGLLALALVGTATWVLRRRARNARTARGIQT